MAPKDDRIFRRTSECTILLFRRALIRAESENNMMEPIDPKINRRLCNAKCMNIITAYTCI